jgi:hypothetical protein
LLDNFVLLLEVELNHRFCHSELAILPEGGVGEEEIAGFAAVREEEEVSTGF